MHGTSISKVWKKTRITQFKEFKSDMSALMLVFFLRWTIFLVGCVLILNDDPANKLMAVGVLIFIMSFTKLKDTEGNL